MHVLATTMVFATLLVTSALAQQGNPAGRSPDTPPTRPGDAASTQTNAQDRLFTMLVAAGGMAEVNASRLAERKADNDAVKAFARRMVQDHSKANDELANVAQHADIRLPAELDQEHRAMQAELEKLSGPEFDVGYMRIQVQEHQKAVQLLEWEIGSGQHAKVQHLASEVLPNVINHLQMAQEIMVRLTGQIAREPVQTLTPSTTEDPQGRSSRGGRERRN
jgi:putative membrane protein